MLTVRFEIRFTGHQNIRSFHPRTIEITKESHLTPQGDCIVGVNASSSCADIPNELKKELRDPKSKIRFSIMVNDMIFEVIGKGHPELVLSHQNDIVIRKSDFICPRTMAIKCDKASDNIPREMILALQNPETMGTFLIETF